MKDLIERLEKATGPDRRLHAAIAVAAGLASEVNPHPSAEGEYARYFFEGRPEECHNRCPNYTGLIDAALALVPEGQDYLIERCQGTIVARVFPPDDLADTMYGISKIPAIAICIAALRARAFAERDLTKMEASNG